jgi:Fe-S-cluster containining protein
MELSAEDIDRIERAGSSNFYLASGGSRQLRNVNGKCVFLDEGGRCSIYQARPEGCRLYPLMMNLSNWQAVLDDDCPHRNRFHIDPDDVMKLDILVRKLTEANL